MQSPTIKAAWLRSHLPPRRDVFLLLIGALVVLTVLGINHLIEAARVPLQPKSSAITSPWIPATVKRWQGPIGEMAKKYDVNPDLIAIIMTLESGGYSKANSGFAQGLMQVSPLTAKNIAAKFLKAPTKTYDIWNPRTNIEFGTAYLAYLRDQFGATDQGPSWNATVELIAAGYNGGPGAAGNLERGKGLHDMQTVVYSRDAYNMWRERHAAVSPTFDRWKERGGYSLLNLAKAEK